MTPGRVRGTCLALSTVTAAIFWLSPVRDLNDSRYSILVADNLLRHGELALDRYFETAPAAGARQPLVKVRPIEWESTRPPCRLPLPDYAVEHANGHVHYFFPHAGSVLALPYVGVLRAAGLSVVDRGRYSARAERRLQAGLAAILMGLVTGIFYLTAVELLPTLPSAMLALVGALGTQVWSTASRVLWSDTWGVTLLALVVWMLVAARARGGELNPYVLGSLLAWMYFVRPTNAVHAALVLAYLAVAHRALLARVVATGALWGIAFVTYSYRTFGTALPPYFQAGRLGTGQALESLLANIASPSRGVVFYVPVVPLALIVLWRYGPHVRDKDLAWLGVAGIAGQFAPLLFFDHWWGGHSYGPRLLTGMVPWVVLVAALAARAARVAAAQAAAVQAERASGRRLGRAAVAAICAWSVLVNGRGAIDARTMRWDVEPVDVDAWPLRVWDWRRPQFLAGLARGQEGPLPLGVWIPLGRRAADALFAGGWGGAEGDVRWSVSPRAALRVRWPMAGPLLLRMRLRPAPEWAASGGQPLALSLDGQEVARWHLTEPGPSLVATPVEADGPDREHRLELRVPDVAVRAAHAHDERPLRTGLYAMRLDVLPVLRRGALLPLGNEAATRFVGSGWGDAEGPYRWTVAPRADLYFADPAAEPAVLRFRVHPFVADPARPGQRVLVGLNGTLVGTLALRSEDSSEHAIALTGGVGRANTLSFELPDAVLPVGARLDPRRLGVAIHWLRLDPLPLLAHGRPVALGPADAAAYLGEGWAEPEGTTRWSVGMKSEVLFKVARPGPGRLLLTMEPFWSRRHPAQRVRIDLNDQRLGELVLDRPGRLPHAIAVPAGVLQAHNVLRLILPDARSPASLGLSRDARMLGVRVGGLELR